LASKITIKFNEQFNSIDLETIAQIFNSSAELASYEYVVLTLKNRKGTYINLDRRAVMVSDRKAYDNLIMNYNLEVDNILDKAILAILIELNLTKEVFDSSI
jgi:hypothetical protein